MTEKYILIFDAPEGDVVVLSALLRAEIPDFRAVLCLT